MNRRSVLAGAGTLGLASLAGCLGTLGLAEHVAVPAGVDPAVRDQTGYDQTDVDDVTVEREVGAGPLSEGIIVRNYMTEHDKAVDMGPLGDQRGAVFIVLATPKISVPGQQFNPVEDMPTEDLVALVENNYDGIGNISHDEDGSVTILEQSTTQSRFTADAEFDGTDLEVNLHISEAVETDDDLVVTIAVYPRDVSVAERENALELMRGVVEQADDGSESEDTDGEGDDGDGIGIGDDDDGDGGDDDDGDGGDGDEDGDNGGDDGDGSSDDEDDDDGLGLGL